MDKDRQDGVEQSCEEEGKRENDGDGDAALPVGYDGGIWNGQKKNKCDSYKADDVHDDADFARGRDVVGTVGVDRDVGAASDSKNHANQQDELNETKMAYRELWCRGGVDEVYESRKESQCG